MADNIFQSSLGRQVVSNSQQLEEDNITGRLQASQEPTEVLSCPLAQHIVLYYYPFGQHILCLSGL